MAHEMRPAELNRLRLLEQAGAPFLRWRDQDGVWHFHTLSDPGPAPLALGRGEGVDIVLVDGRVSALHAELRKSGDEWLVADAASTNGTHVNGDRVTTVHRLAHEDVLRVGDTLVYFHASGGGRRVPTTVQGRSVERKDLTDAQWTMLTALCRPRVIERSRRVPSTRELAEELVLSASTVNHTLGALNEVFGADDATQGNKRGHVIDEAVTSGLVSIASYRA